MEIPSSHRFFQSAKVAAVILRDVALPFIEELFVAPFRDVIRRIAIRKTIRQRKINHVLVPRTNGRVLRECRENSDGAEKE